MKNTAYIVTLIIAVSRAYGQVCNTASTLRPAKFSLGVAPIIYVRGGDLGLLVDGGVGITRNIDLSFKLVINNGPTYFGGDFEFLLLSGMPMISLATGMHSAGNIGVDGTLNITFPIQRIVSLYGGLDANIEFYNQETLFPLWFFLGIQVMARKTLGIFMEIDGGISSPAPSILDLGINIYF